MPRYRTIKPEFWTSAQVLECSTNARLLFVGLWNFCDDYGRHPFSPKQCKAEVFPADPFTSEEIEAMLEELETNNLIIVYGHEDTQYFYVTGWHHQRIDKPQKPKYPDPFDEHSEMIPRTLSPEGNRIEGNRIEGSRGSDADRTRAKKRAHAPTQKAKGQPRQEAKRAPRAPMPEAWQPSEAGEQYAAHAGIPSARVPYLTRRCRDYHIRNGTMIAGERGLAATWRTWVDNEVKFSAEKNGEVVDLEPRHSEITKGMTPEQKKAYVDEEMRKFREANRVG